MHIATVAQHPSDWAGMRGGEPSPGCDDLFPQRLNRLAQSIILDLYSGDLILHSR
jgi:hypothetical protein